MDNERLALEVEGNYDAFTTVLEMLLPKHRGQYALLRDGKTYDFYADAGSALAAGRASFIDGLYSIQEVTDRPADLGFFSHAVDSRIA